jgi:hypothetical protein
VRSAALTTEKTAVLAPTPSASAATATAVTARFFQSVRAANLKSFRSVPIPSKPFRA